MEDNAACKVSISVGGSQQEIPFDIYAYKAAEAQNLSLSQYINRKYQTDERDPGTAFSQISAACGLVLAEDPNFGYRSPTISDLISGKAALASGIVAPDGESRFTPAGALFFPALVIDTLEASLRDNHGSYTQAFMTMVAMTRSITSPKYDKVIIDYSRPRDTRPQPISQLAEPAKMLSITTSSVSRSIGTHSIGLEISAEAQAAATMDLIAIALREHSEEERARRLDIDLLNVLNGDVDSGEAGVIGAAFTAKSLDATLTTNGVLSQKAWVKFLLRNWKRRRITHVVGNIDTYLAVEGRTGRPVKDGEPAVDERLNTIPQMAINLIPASVQFFPMEDFPANTLMGIDASKALMRVVHVTAAYSAIQEFVLRKSRAFRVDTSERIESIGYTEAFDVMTLTGN